MKRCTLALSVMALLVTLPASAQFRKPEDAIKYRKSAMTLMNAHMGRMAQVVQGRVAFDAKATADNAQIVATLSALPFGAFTEGSDKGDTRAKPEIWTEATRFKGQATKMQESVAALNAAAKSGNFDQIKTTFGEVDKACKACHDDYRKD